MTEKKLRSAELLPPLSVNKKYMKRMKFNEKKKEAVAAAERGRSTKSQNRNNKNKKSKLIDKNENKKKNNNNNNAKNKKKGAKESVEVVGQKNKKTIKATAKKTSLTSVKEKKGKKITSVTAKTKNNKNNKKQHNEEKHKETSIDTTIPSQKNKEQESLQYQHLTQEELDRELIERAIRGEEGTPDSTSLLLTSTTASSSSFPYGNNEGGDLSQYSYLPFLEDYAEQKRSELVSPETLLRNAHAYFKDLGKRESAMRRVAAKRLRELKEINRRGGDKDGFRYVVPKNVKEVVRQMSENAAGGNSEIFDIDNAQLTSTFGGDEVQESEEKPMHRRKRKKSCYSDFYQFQVSKRWTRNAENFLNKGRAHKSMFGAAKQQRSIKKL